MTEAQIESLAAQIAEKVTASNKAAAQVLPVSPDAAIWISRADAAKRIGVSLPTLHGLIRRGAVDAKKVGRRTLINAADLMSKLASGELAKYNRIQ